MKDSTAITSKKPCSDSVSNSDCESEHTCSISSNSKKSRKRKSKFSRYASRKKQKTKLNTSRSRSKSTSSISTCTSPSSSSSVENCNEKDDKTFINAYKLVNLKSRLSVSERYIMCKEKKVVEVTSSRKSSLRPSKSNKFVCPLKEVITDSQIDISTVTMVSHRVLKKKNNLLKREKKEQNRKVKHVARQNSQLKDENKTLTQDIIQSREESDKKKAALVKTLTMKDKCINELKRHMNTLNESGDAALARRDRLIDRLSAELKEIKVASKEMTKSIKILQKTNDKKELKLTRTRELKAKALGEVRKHKATMKRLNDEMIEKNVKIKLLNDANETLEFNMQLHLTEQENNVTVIGREKTANYEACPLVVMKVTIEMLVNGTKPSAVAKNLESTIRLVCPNVVKINELPNVDYVRKMRGVMRIVTETLAVYRLGKDQNWLQLWWDGTSRRTVSLTTLAAGIKEAGTTMPTLMSCSHAALGGASEQTVAAIADVIEAGQEHLSEWKETVETMHPDFNHDIPGPESLSLSNCKNAAFTTDTCNQACKSRSLLIEKVNEEGNANTTC